MWSGSGYYWLSKLKKTMRLATERMGFSTTDWMAFFILGASALASTFGKRLVRIIGPVGEPSLEIRTRLGFRGVAPQMRDRAAYLTLGGGAGGRSPGSI
jgi:hypothetical protein